MMELCCVVDQSGSMGGTPIANLRAALESFIGSLDETTFLSLVGFSDSAQILAPSSGDHAAALYAAQQLSGFGRDQYFARASVWGWRPWENME